MAAIIAYAKSAPADAMIHPTITGPVISPAFCPIMTSAVALDSERAGMRSAR